MPAPAVVTLASCPVPYTILRDPAPTLDGDSTSGWTATLSFRVAMSDLFAFCQFAAGQPVVYTGGITKIIPLSHPQNARLLCLGIKSNLVGSWTPANPVWGQQWSDSRVTLTFKTVPFATDGSTPFMVTETRAGAETYTLSGVRLSFADGTPIQADAGVNVPTVVYSTTIYLAASLADDVLNPIVGTVNSSGIVLASATLGAGTLRFDSYSSRITTTTSFQTAYERSLFCTWRPIPWNQFLKPNGTWDTPTAPGGATVYSSASFAPLFA